MTVPKKSLSATQQQSLVKRAGELADKWNTYTPHQQIEYLKSILHKVCVSGDAVELHIAPESIHSYLMNKRDIKPDTGTSKVVTLPAKLKRCGIETQLVVNDHSEQGPHQITIDALQKKLLPGLQWYEEFLTGAVTSTAQLAKRENLDQRYIAFILKLNFLAPDIMEAIIQGNIPMDLNIARLKKGFPMDWDRQRKELGFTPQ